MKPLISVVVPTYRRPDLLLRCLDALRTQSFDGTAYEIIVVSDGEDTATSRSLASYAAQNAPALRYYSLPHKAGPAAARNLGWALAEGELIAFTDDDCIPDTGWLSEIRSAWASMFDAGEIAFSGNTIVPLTGPPTDYEKNISQLASAEFITANCACTVQALQKVGGFDERFRMAWREDSDLQFKFVQAGIPIIRLQRAIVTHPVREAPWGVSIGQERKNMFNALLYKKYPSLYREKIQQAPPWHYYAVAFFLIMFVTGIITGKPLTRTAGLFGWALMTGWFAVMRLRHTSRSWKHVSEMIVTSALIPPLSLFWNWYGAWKYKVFLP